jgi:hypothetical protein
MSFNFSPKIVTDKLVFCLDSANMNSYPGTGDSWNPLVDKLGFNMSLTNGPTFSNTNLGTLIFDGIDDCVQSDISYQNKIVETMSFDVWFMRDVEVNPFNMIYSSFIPYLAFRGTSGSNTNRFLFSFFTKLSGVSTQRYLYSINTYEDNIWYNVVCTLNLNASTGTVDSKMYVNGELENTLTYNSGTLDTLYQPGNSTRLKIGDYSLTSYPFAGKIPTFKIYEKILSTEEVKQNYNALKNRYI